MQDEPSSNSHSQMDGDYCMFSYYLGAFETKLVFLLATDDDDFQKIWRVTEVPEDVTEAKIEQIKVGGVPLDTYLGQTIRSHYKDNSSPFSR